MIPKGSINDRFYKVFASTFLDASKRCFTKGFLMFSENVKLHQLLVKNIMLFGYFSVHFEKRAPKVFINDRFYKVFPSTFPDDLLPIKRNVLGDFEGFYER